MLLLYSGKIIVLKIYEIIFLTGELKMDKRVLKTRNAVFNAVFELTMQEELKKITVLDLCKKAGINKSTFYLHYSSIDDCLQKCFDYVMNGVTEFCKTLQYDEIVNCPESNLNLILDEIEKDINYILKFKTSAIYPKYVSLLKESLVNSIIEANNFNIKDNYNEIVTIVFIVGGCIDAFTKPLPEFDRKALESILTGMIKKN